MNSSDSAERATQGTAALRPDRPARDDFETIKRRFIIMREPGCVPVKKSPPVQTEAGMTDMLLGLYRHQPHAALTAVELTWNDDLWVSDGRERLIERLCLGGIDLPDGRRVSLRIGCDLRSLWIALPGSRAKKCCDLKSASDAVSYVAKHLYREGWEIHRRTGLDDGEAIGPSPLTNTPSEPSPSSYLPGGKR